MALRIEMDGIHGAGKTTLFQKLVETYMENDIKVFVGKETGINQVAWTKVLKRFLLDKNEIIKPEEFVSGMAAIRLGVHEYYKRIEKEFDIILSDRGWLTQVAYSPEHFEDKKKGEEFTKEIFEGTLGYTKLPDKIYIIEAPIEMCLKRTQERRDGNLSKIEAKEEGFHRGIKERMDVEAKKLTAKKKVIIAKIDNSLSLERSTNEIKRCALEELSMIK